jgi:hypothetical protein
VSIEDTDSSDHPLNTANHYESIATSGGAFLNRSESNIYMNCDLIEQRYGSGVGGVGAFDTGSQGGEDTGTPDRSSLNEISDLENQLDSSGGGSNGHHSHSKYKMRSNILNEIVQTERNYLKSLKLIIEVSFFLSNKLKTSFFCSMLKLILISVYLVIQKPVATNENFEPERNRDSFCQH